MGVMKKTAFHSFRVGNNNPVIAGNKVYDVAEHSVAWGAGVITLKKIEEVKIKSPVVPMV